MRPAPRLPRNHLIVGTRTSRLARWQSEHVIALLQKSWPGLTCELRPFQTKGDRTLDRPLPEIGGKGLFTAELEQALSSGDIDIAVHSLKDLPVQNPPGLTIGAVPAREDVADVLVNDRGYTLATLPPGAVVGTSSLRRQAQLLGARPDLQIRSIRGNVETRVRKALEGQYDAAVLAIAGLNRLDMQDLPGHTLTLDEMLPAPGQGALAVQCRAGDDQTLALLGAIDNLETRQATIAEREFLLALGGGCSAPIAAYARHIEGELVMDGLVASPEGANLLRVSAKGVDALALARTLAAEARRQGADRFLDTQTDPAMVSQPLGGLKIVITRAPHQAPEFAARLRSLGATPILFPTIDIAPFDETGALETAIHQLPEYDWVIFTSVNGVTVFWEQLQALGYGADLFQGVRIAAIGPATAGALSAIGLQPTFVPQEYVAERIAEGLGDVSGLKILLPRAEQARAALAELLDERGALVNEIATYQTTLAAPDHAVRAQLASADAITFTSSSTVRNFVTIVGAQRAREIVSRPLVACIGPITAATASELDLEPGLVASDYTIDGLIAALVAYYN